MAWEPLGSPPSTATIEHSSNIPSRPTPSWGVDEMPLTRTLCPSPSRPVRLILLCKLDCAQSESGLVPGCSVGAYGARAERSPARWCVLPGMAGGRGGTEGGGVCVIEAAP